MSPYYFLRCLSLNKNVDKVQQRALHSVFYLISHHSFIKLGRLKKNIRNYKMSLYIPSVYVPQKGRYANMGKALNNSKLNILNDILYMYYSQKHNFFRFSRFISKKRTEQNTCDLSDVFYVHVAFG